MVQAPDFLTLAAQEVRSDWSRSVAVMVNLSSAASKRKFERMGMVVLRSTTDCAAVSSRRSSARGTVISRFPVGAVVISGSWFPAGVLLAAASWATGVIGVSPALRWSGVLVRAFSEKRTLGKLYTESGAGSNVLPLPGMILLI